MMISLQMNAKELEFNTILCLYSPCHLLSYTVLDLQITAANKNCFFSSMGVGGFLKGEGQQKTHKQVMLHKENKICKDMVNSHESLNIQ